MKDFVRQHDKRSTTDKVVGRVMWFIIILMVVLFIVLAQIYGA